MKKKTTGSLGIVSREIIQSKILVIRAKRVMLDSDLAELYGVPTKALNLAVKRNHNRFPDDFMFKFTQEEQESLRFQYETSKKGRGGRRYLPHVFTQEGYRNSLHFLLLIGVEM